MTLTERAERILKDLDRLSREIHEASAANLSLDDKIVMQRTYRELCDARNIVRKHYYNIEDAEKARRAMA